MAHPVNEARQKAIDAEKALNALLDQQIAAKAAYAELLEKQAAGTLPETDKEKLAKAAADAKGYDSRISAARELATLRKEEQAAAEEKAAVEAERGKTKGSRIEVGAPNAEDDPKKGFRSHRDFLMSAIENSGLRDRSQVKDERLKLVAVQDKEDKMAAGELAFMLPVAFTPSYLSAAGSDEQGTYDDRYGGFTVGKTLLPGILSVGFEGDPTAGRTQAVPMATPTVELLARTDKNHTTSVSGGFTVTRRPETASITSSRSTMEMVTMKASSLFGLAYATEELLSDSLISFVAVIDSGFRDQFGFHMIGEKLRGTGGGEYLGILTALAASSLGPTISIAKESGQAADTIVYNNVIKARARAWGYNNAIWLANHDCYPQLAVLAVPVGVAGQLIYQQSAVEGRPDMLLGRPIFYTEYASTVGDQGDLILANFSQYLEGVYQPLQSAESVHVRFVNHERTFKFWLRNAGAPWWKAALTPNKSSSTLSPFVVLDARA